VEVSDVSKVCDTLSAKVFMSAKVLTSFESHLTQSQISQLMNNDASISASYLLII